MEVPAELLAYTNRNPLETTLNRFRSTFDTSSNPIDVILILFLDLLRDTIHLDQSPDNMAIKELLSKLIPKLSTNQNPVSEFSDLVALINSYAGDHEIWSIAIQIADRINKEYQPTNSVPLTSVAKKECSKITNSASASELVGDNANATLVTMALKHELRDKTYRNIDQFWELNFENKSWSKTTTQIWKSYSEDCQRGIGNVFSDYMDEKAVRRWMHAFRDRYLIQLMKSSNKSEKNGPAAQRDQRKPHVRGKFCYISKPSEHNGGLNDCQVDIFMKSSDVADSVENKWRDIRVVGEISSSNEHLADRIHLLMRYMREIFYSQPLRRFAHGFCLHKNHMELWIVDRAGAYSSGEIDVSKSQEKLIRALSSYMLMSDEDLGLDSITSYDSDGRCFVTVPNAKTSVERIEVNPLPITRPETIVSRGTTCLETKDSMYMLKFSWSTESVESETKIFKSVKDVTGVIKLNYSSDLYDIDDHRMEMKFTEDKKWDIYFGDRTLYHSVSTGSQGRKSYIQSKLIYAKFSPAGRPLQSSSTVREFVHGIRNAIIGHRNLYERGIIHGNISARNIILTKADVRGASEGILTGLDKALYRQEKKGKKQHESFTGTRKYMALELLEAIDEKEYTLKQTYRHDLESFFYVLIAGCMSYCRKKAPKHLQYWHSDNTRFCFTSKQSDIILHFQKKILNYFTPVFECVQELALSLRQILFDDKSVGYGTPENPNVLYDPIIRAFDDTIRKLEADVRERNKDDCIRIEA
ncbi:BgTH12-05439 [Blumeria graminis f. sp. triticale]|uniref:BgTH12-05439 n=1 Tax=Blumeria graminis f. sp. triticale TaxID=1689686 RepID=A0A9W4GGG5_BLUGR|nr:BgTH12-05439 [Blumeria graminis f. sp. triticale]